MNPILAIVLITLVALVALSIGNRALRQGRRDAEKGEAIYQYLASQETATPCPTCGCKPFLIRGEWHGCACETKRESPVDLTAVALKMLEPSGASPFKDDKFVEAEGDPDCQHVLAEGDYTDELRAKYGPAFKADSACWFAVFRSVRECTCGRKVIVQEAGRV